VLIDIVIDYTQRIKMQDTFHFSLNL